jgi:hypothetical protein
MYTYTYVGVAAYTYAYALTYTYKLELCEISGFRREVDGYCALLGYYAACIGISLPSFRENIGRLFKVHEPKKPRPLKMGPIICPETSVKSYY